MTRAATLKITGASNGAVFLFLQRSMTHRSILRGGHQPQGNHQCKNPAQNILVAPDDVISVPRAKMVYVIGTVPKPGGYILGEDTSFSILRAVSLAGGIDRGANAGTHAILRQVSGNETAKEIPVNLKTIMAGQAKDVALQAEDILFVPANGAKTAVGRAAEAALQVTTGLTIYRF